MNDKQIAAIRLLDEGRIIISQVDAGSWGYELETILNLIADLADAVEKEDS